MEPRIEANKGFGVTAIFARQCGHEERLFYSSAKLARADMTAAARTMCDLCRNRAIVEEQERHKMD